MATEQPTNLTHHYCNTRSQFSFMGNFSEVDPLAGDMSTKKDVAKCVIAVYKSESNGSEYHSSQVHK
jgi:hypothetical protein